MASPFDGAADSRQRSSQTNRNRADRYLEYGRDFAIPQAFGAEKQAPAILFRKGIDNGRNRLLFAAGGQLIFRIGRWIDNKLLQRQVGYSKTLRIPAVITPLS